MDETWIHHFTSESKGSSSEWTAAGEPRPKRSKAQQSAGKVMALVFWDAHGIIFIDYREKGKSINSDIIGSFESRNCEKTTAYGEEKNYVSPRQCTMSQVNKNDGKIARITFRIASSSTV